MLPKRSHRKDTRSKLNESGDQQTQVFGKYRLMSLLGRGAYSTVYCGELHSSYGFRKRVALKVMRRRLSSTNEPASQEFLNEARLGAAVQHPNLVEFYECGRVGDRLYIAMELVEGPSLAELIKVGPNLGLVVDDAVVLAVAMHAARGLRALHQAVVDDKPILAIHRDFKPGNILLSPAGQAKLTDYGVARYAADSYQTITANGPLGSPLYMSPEQARGEEVTQASDVFSFGTTILELINGRPVFGSSTIEGVIRNVDRADVGDALMSARARFPTLVPVLESCLLTDPTNRIPHGSALVEALKDVTPPAFAEEQVAEVAAQVFRAVEFQRQALRRNPIEQFWSKLSDDDDSVSERLHTMESLAQDVPPERTVVSAAEHAEELDDEIPAQRSDRRFVWLVAAVILLALVVGAAVWVPQLMGARDKDRAGGAEPNAMSNDAGGVPVGDEVPTEPDAQDDPTPAGEPREETTDGPHPQEEPPSPAQVSEAVEPTAEVVVPPPPPVVSTLAHTPVGRGIRGQSTDLPVTIDPAARRDLTLWFRAAPDGAWQTRSVEGGQGGSAMLSLPSGAWLPADGREVDYFIEMDSGDGVIRSGSAARPHRLTLY